MGEVFGCTCANQFSSTQTTVRSKVDHPVGSLDDIKVVFDHDHRITLVPQTMEDTQKLANIVEVKAGGGFVENIQGPTGRTLGELS